MSKVRNISGGPLDVPLLGRSVEADEVIEVPDFQPAHSADNPLPITWPPDKWEAVSDAPPAVAYSTAYTSIAASVTTEGM